MSKKRDSPGSFTATEPLIEACLRQYAKSYHSYLTEAMRDDWDLLKFLDYCQREVVPAWVTRTMVIFARSHLEVIMSFLLQWRTTAITPAAITQAIPSNKDITSEHAEARSTREQKYRGLVDILFASTLKAIILPLVHREAFDRLTSSHTNAEAISSFSALGSKSNHHRQHLIALGVSESNGGKDSFSLSDALLPDASFSTLTELVPVANSFTPVNELLEYPPLRMRSSDLLAIEKVCIEFALQEPCIQPARGTFASLFSASSKDRLLHRLQHQLYIIYRLRGTIWPKAIGALTRATVSVNRCVEALNGINAEGKKASWELNPRVSTEVPLVSESDYPSEDQYLDDLHIDKEEHKGEIPAKIVRGKYSKSDSYCSTTRQFRHPKSNLLSRTAAKLSFQLAAHTAGQGLNVQSLNFGSSLLALLDPTDKQVTAEQARRLLPFLTFFWLDLSCKVNLQAAVYTLNSLSQLFTKAKGDKSRSLLKRSICHAVHNVLWSVAEQSLVPKVDYSQWFALLVATHSSILEWAEKKKTDWLVAMPALTALVCASPKENFIMNFASLQKTLIRSYSQPHACVTALRCAQRVLYIYLSRVSDRLETTISALRSVTGDIVRAAHNHSLFVSALLSEDRTLSPAVLLRPSAAQMHSPPTVQWVFGSAETEDAFLAVVATVAAWSPVKALELLVLPMVSLSSARGLGLLPETPTKQDMVISAKMSKVGSAQLSPPISNEVLAVGMRALALVLGGRNAALPLLHGMSQPRITSQTLTSLIASISVVSTDPLLPCVVDAHQAFAVAQTQTKKQAHSENSPDTNEDTYEDQPSNDVSGAGISKQDADDGDERILTAQANAISLTLGIGESSFSWSSTAHVLADLLPRLQNLEQSHLADVSVPTVTVSPTNVTGTANGAGSPSAPSNIVTHPGGPGSGLRTLTSTISTLLSRAFSAVGSYVYSAYNPASTPQLLEKEAPAIITLRLALQCAAYVWPAQIASVDLLNMLNTSLLHVDRGVRAAAARLLAFLTGDTSRPLLRSSALNSLSSMISSLPPSVPGAALPPSVLASPEASTLVAKQLSYARTEGMQVGDSTGFSRMRIVSPEAVDTFARSAQAMRDSQKLSTDYTVSVECEASQQLLSSITSFVSTMEDSIEELATQLQVDIVHAGRGAAVEDIGSEAFFACAIQHERLLTLWSEDAALTLFASQNLAKAAKLEINFIAKQVTRIHELEDAVSETERAIEEAKSSTAATQDGNAVENAMFYHDHVSLELQRERSQMYLRMVTLLQLLETVSKSQVNVGQHISSLEHLSWTQSEAACVIGLCSASASVRLASLRGMAVLHSLAVTHMGLVQIEQHIYALRVAIVRAYATLQTISDDSKSLESDSKNKSVVSHNPVTLAAKVKSTKPPAVNERLLTCLKPQRHLIAVFTSLRFELEEYLASLSHGSSLPHIPDLALDPNSVMNLRERAMEKLREQLNSQNSNQYLIREDSSTEGDADQFLDLIETGWLPSNDGESEFVSLSSELDKVSTLSISGWNTIVYLASSTKTENQSQWTVAFAFLLRCAVTEFMSQDAAAAVKASKRAYESVATMLAGADSVSDDDIEAAAASAAAAAGVALGIPACATLVRLMSVIKNRLQPLFTFSTKKAAFSAVLTAVVPSTTQSVFDSSIVETKAGLSGASSWAAATGALLDITQTALGKSRPGVESASAALAGSSATSQTVHLTLSEQPDALLITMRNSAVLACICCICDATMHAQGEANLRVKSRARIVARAARSANRSQPGTPSSSRPGTPINDSISRPSTPGSESDCSQSSGSHLLYKAKESSIDPAKHARRGCIPLSVSPLNIRDNFGIMQEMLVLLMSPIAPIRRIASTALGSVHPLGAPVLLHGVLDLERALYGASVFEGLPLYAHSSFGDNAVAAANALKLEFQAQFIASEYHRGNAASEDALISNENGSPLVAGDAILTNNECALSSAGLSDSFDVNAERNATESGSEVKGEEESSGEMGFGDLRIVKKHSEIHTISSHSKWQAQDEPTYEDRMRAAGIPSDPTGGLNLGSIRALIRASGLGRPSSRRQNDEIRVAIAHVYRLLVESVDSAFLLLNPHVNARVFIFVQETFRFFAHIGHEFRWDLLGLRVNYCATIRKLALGALAPVTIDTLRADAEFELGFISSDLTDSVKSDLEIPTLPAGDLLGGAITRCDPTALAAVPETNVSHIPLSLTGELRRSLFEFLIAWCGHGPSSSAHTHKVEQHRDELLGRVKSKDRLLKQSLRHAFEEQINLLQIASLHAMAALVAAPNFDRVLPLQLKIVNSGGTIGNARGRALDAEGSVFFSGDTGNQDGSSDAEAALQVSEAQRMLRNSAPGLIEGSVFEWLNATLTSSDPAVRDIGYLALHMFLCANPALLPVFVAQCYSPQVVVARRYFLVVARVLIQGAELERKARTLARREAHASLEARSKLVKDMDSEEEEYLSLIDDEYDSIDMPRINQDTTRKDLDDESDEEEGDDYSENDSANKSMMNDDDNQAEADRRALLRVLKWSAEAASGGRAHITARVAAARHISGLDANNDPDSDIGSALQAVGSVWNHVPLEIIANLALSKVADASYAVRSMALRILPRVEIRVTRTFSRPKQFYHHSELQRSGVRANSKRIQGSRTLYMDALSSTVVDATRYSLLTSQSAVSAVKTQKLWSSRLASLHPDFSLPFITEVCKRVQCAPTETSEKQMLAYMAPFISRVILSAPSCPHSTILPPGSSKVPVSKISTAAAAAIASNVFLSSHTFLTVAQTQKLLGMLFALTLANQGTSSPQLDLIWSSLIQACFLPIAHFPFEQSKLGLESSQDTLAQSHFSSAFATQISSELALVTPYPSYEDATGQTLRKASYDGYKVIGGTGIRRFDSPGCTKRSGAELRNPHVIIEYILQIVPSRLKGRLSTKVLQACRSIVMCAARSCQLYVLHALSLEIAPNRLYEQQSQKATHSLGSASSQETADVFSLVYTSRDGHNDFDKGIGERTSIGGPYLPTARSYKSHTNGIQASYAKNASEAIVKFKKSGFKATVCRPEDSPAVERYTACSAPALGLLEQTLMSSSTLAFVLLVDAAYEFSAAPALQAAQNSTAIAACEIEHGPVDNSASAAAVSMDQGAFLREPSPLEALAHVFHVGVQALAGHNKSVIRHHAAALLLNTAHALYLLPALSEDDPIARAAKHLHRSSAYTRFSPKAFLNLCEAVEEALVNPSHEKFAPACFSDHDSDKKGNSRGFNSKAEYIPQLLMNVAVQAGFSYAALSSLWSHLALRWATVVRRRQPKCRSLAIFRAIQSSFQPSSAPILFDILSAAVVPVGSSSSSGSSRLAFQNTSVQSDRYSFLEAQALADREDLANAAEVIPGPESMSPALTSILRSAGNFAPGTDWVLVQEIVLSIQHALHSIDPVLGPWLHTSVANKPGVFTHAVNNGYKSQEAVGISEEVIEGDNDEMPASPISQIPAEMHGVLVPSACPFNDDPSSWPHHLLSANSLTSSQKSPFLPSVPMPSDHVLCREFPLTIARACASLRCVSTFVRTALWAVVGLLRLDLLPGDVEKGRGAMQTPVYRGVFLESTKLFQVLLRSFLLSAEPPSSYLPAEESHDSAAGHPTNTSRVPWAVSQGYVTSGLFSSFAHWVQWNAVILPGPVASSLDPKSVGSNEDMKFSPQVSRIPEDDDSEHEIEDEGPESENYDIANEPPDDSALPLAFTGIHSLLLRGLFTLDIEVRCQALLALIALWSSRPALLSLADVSMFIRARPSDSDSAGGGPEKRPNESSKMLNAAIAASGLAASALIASNWRLSPIDVPRTVNDWCRGLLPAKRMKRFASAIPSMLRHSPASLVLVMTVPFLHSSLVCQANRSVSMVAPSPEYQFSIGSRLKTRSPGVESAFSPSFIQIALQHEKEKPESNNSMPQGVRELTTSVLSFDVAIQTASSAAKLALCLRLDSVSVALQRYSNTFYHSSLTNSNIDELNSFALPNTRTTDSSRNSGLFLEDVGSALISSLSGLDSGLAAFAALKSEAKHSEKLNGEAIDPSALVEGGLPSFVLSACSLLVECLERQVHDFLIAELVSGSLPQDLENSIALVHPGLRRVLFRFLPKSNGRIENSKGEGIVASLSEIGIQTKVDLGARVKSLESSLLVLDNSIMCLFLLIARGVDWTKSGLDDPRHIAPLLRSLIMRSGSSSSSTLIAASTTSAAAASSPVSVSSRSLAQWGPSDSILVCALSRIDSSARSRIQGLVNTYTQYSIGAMLNSANPHPPTTLGVEDFGQSLYATLENRRLSHLSAQLALLANRQQAVLQRRSLAATSTIATPLFPLLVAQGALNLRAPVRECHPEAVAESDVVYDVAHAAASAGAFSQDGPLDLSALDDFKSERMDEACEGPSYGNDITLETGDTSPSLIKEGEICTSAFFAHQAVEGVAAGSRAQQYDGVVEELEEGEEEEEEKYLEEEESEDAFRFNAQLKPDDFENEQFLAYFEDSPEPSQEEIEESGPAVVVAMTTTVVTTTTTTSASATLGQVNHDEGLGEKLHIESPENVEQTVESISGSLAEPNEKANDTLLQQTKEEVLGGAEQEGVEDSLLTPSRRAPPPIPRRPPPTNPTPQVHAHEAGEVSVNTELGQFCNTQSVIRGPLEMEAEVPLTNLGNEEIPSLINSPNEENDKSINRGLDISIEDEAMTMGVHRPGLAKDSSDEEDHEQEDYVSDHNNQVYMQSDRDNHTVKYSGDNVSNDSSNGQGIEVYEPSFNQRNMKDRYGVGDDYEEEIHQIEAFSPAPRSQHYRNQSNMNGVAPVHNEQDPDLYYENHSLHVNNYDDLQQQQSQHNRYPHHAPSQRVNREQAIQVQRSNNQDHRMDPYFSPPARESMDARIVAMLSQDDDESSFYDAETIPYHQQGGLRERAGPMNRQQHQGHPNGSRSRHGHSRELSHGVGLSPSFNRDHPGHSRAASAAMPRQAYPYQGNQRYPQTMQPSNQRSPFNQGRPQHTPTQQNQRVRYESQQRNPMPNELRGGYSTYRGPSNNRASPHISNQNSYTNNESAMGNRRRWDHPGNNQNY